MKKLKNPLFKQFEIKNLSHTIGGYTNTCDGDKCDYLVGKPGESDPCNDIVYSECNNDWQYIKTPGLPILGGNTPR